MTRRHGVGVGPDVPARTVSVLTRNLDCRFGKIGDWDVVEENICKETTRRILHHHDEAGGSEILLIPSLYMVTMTFDHDELNGI